MPILSNYCGCFSLRSGTIVSGVLGILAAIAALIIALVTKLKLKSIIYDKLSLVAVKIIFSADLIVSILISILLIIGALKRNNWLMLPWAVLSVILIIGTFISVIYTSVEYYLSDDSFVATTGLVIGLSLVGIQIYMWLVVISYMQLIKEEKNRGPYGRPMHNT